jgi:hypothetical protein
MADARYQLFFGTVKIGDVTETGSDFPNLWGDIVYDPALATPRSPEVARLINFIALNRESTRLLDMEHEHDVAQQQAQVNAQLEASYLDLIESEDWNLIDEHGRELPILGPILRGDNELVWRWDPRR